MSNTNQSNKDTVCPESLLLHRAGQNIQESSITFNNLDLLLSSQDFQHDIALQMPEFSSDASAMEVPMLPGGRLPGTSNSDPVWNPSHLNHPPVDPSSDQLALQILTYHVQSLDTQVRSLDARVQALEAQYQRANNTIEEFTKWSEKMENHCEETNNTVLELSGIVRTVLRDDEMDGREKKG